MHILFLYDCVWVFKAPKIFPEFSGVFIYFFYGFILFSGHWKSFFHFPFPFSFFSLNLGRRPVLLLFPHFSPTAHSLSPLSSPLPAQRRPIFLFSALPPFPSLTAGPTRHLLPPPVSGLDSALLCAWARGPARRGRVARTPPPFFSVYPDLVEPSSLTSLFAFALNSARPTC